MNQGGLLDIFLLILLLERVEIETTDLTYATLWKEAKKRLRLLAVTLVFYGALGEIRTPDLRIRSPLLYPAELQAHIL